MKKLKGIIMAIASLFLLAGCAGSAGASSGTVSFTAVVNSVSDGVIDATVNDDGVHFGEYRILVSVVTRYYHSDGTGGSLKEIETGDIIEVTYNGQVMRSFPPQVAAIKIVIAAKSK